MSGQPPVTRPEPGRDRSALPVRRVLFVCEYNSCRSQLAEALARHACPATWIIHSAGLVGTTVSALVREVLAETGLATDEHRSKALDEVPLERVDDVVVLAAPAVEAVRRRFPEARVQDWSMDDPLQAPGGLDVKRQAVRDACDVIARRLDAWLGGEPDA